MKARSPSAKPLTPIALAPAVLRTAPSDLIPPSFLFRFSVACQRRQPLWTPAGLALDDSHRLPALAELDELPQYADVRAAWADEGLSFSVRVQGKKQAPWCRENRLEDSDGFHVWIDTRDTHNVHRAGRFCQHFAFLPAGGGHRLDDPVAEQCLINRARENAKPVRPGVLRARAEKRIDGYVLDVHIPAIAMTGFEPAEHPRLGFMYAVYDRELGVQTFSTGSEFPYQEDPSLWATLELVK